MLVIFFSTFGLPGCFDPLIENNPAGEIIYFHPNHIGSVRTISDRYGNLIARYRHKPYGELLVDKSFGTTRTKYKYTAQEEDSTTGLYYYNSRFYDPAVGRFITPDTIVPDPTNTQAFNRYMYAYGNPVRYNDPSGTTTDAGYSQYAGDAAAFVAAASMAFQCANSMSLSGIISADPGNADAPGYNPYTNPGIYTLWPYSYNNNSTQSNGPKALTPAKGNGAQTPKGDNGESAKTQAQDTAKEVAGPKSNTPDVSPFFPPGTSIPITSDYGPRSDPFTGKTQFHTGFDVGAPENTPILFPKGNPKGSVQTGENETAGKWVKFNYGYFMMFICHAKTVLVTNGQTANPGQALAAVGKTGVATGFHAHIGYFVNGIPVNPMDANSVLSAYIHYSNGANGAF